MRAIFTHPAFAVALFALLALGPVSLLDIDRQVHRNGYGQAHDGPETRHEKVSSGETGDNTADNDAIGRQHEQNRWYDPASPITTLLHTLMLAVTAIGVIFIARTLGATRDAVREARIANQAAMIAAEAARDMAMADRAWVTFDNVEVVETPVPYVTIYWKNVGRSPAILIQSTLTATNTPTAVDRPPPFEVEHGTTSGSNITVGAEQFSSCGPYAFTRVVWNAFRAKARRIYVHALIRYRDINSPEIIRETEICGELFLNEKQDLLTGQLLGQWGIMHAGDQNRAT